MRRPYREIRPYHLYRIIQASTGRVYVGLSTDPDFRWKRHLYCARAGHDHPLYEAMRQAGPDDFKMMIVEIIDDARIAHAAEAQLMRAENTFVPTGFNKPPYRRAPRGAEIIPRRPLRQDTADAIASGIAKIHGIAF